MKHIKKKIFIGKKKSHIKSIIINLSNSLILHNYVITILSRAKKMVRFLEPILYVARINSFNNRRKVFNKLRNKTSVDILFKKIHYDIKNYNNGGFIRIVKIGYRLGDRSKMCISTFVFNSNLN